jgi:hypothetical protein
MKKKRKKKLKAKRESLLLHAQATEQARPAKRRLEVD